MDGDGGGEFGGFEQGTEEDFAIFSVGEVFHGDGSGVFIEMVVLEEAGETGIIESDDRGMDAGDGWLSGLGAGRCGAEMIGELEVILEIGSEVVERGLSVVNATDSMRLVAKNLSRDIVKGGGDLGGFFGVKSELEVEISLAGLDLERAGKDIDEKIHGDEDGDTESKRNDSGAVFFAVTFEIFMRKSAADAEDLTDEPGSAEFFGVNFDVGGATNGRDGRDFFDFTGNEESGTEDGEKTESDGKEDAVKRGMSKKTREARAEKIMQEMIDKEYENIIGKEAEKNAKKDAKDRESEAFLEDGKLDLTVGGAEGLKDAILANLFSGGNGETVADDIGGS